MTPGHTPAQNAIQVDRRAQAALTILAWLARSDGPVGHRKAAAISQVAVQSGSAMARRLPEALRDCESIGFEELRQAIELAIAMPERMKAALMAASVAVAFSEPHPGPAAEHALRLIADICAETGKGEYVLARAFERHRARLRPPGDPTSFDWWSHKGERGLGERTEAGILTARGLAELRDLATLGLAPGAGEREIRDAYRDFARQYHPDRFHDRPDEVRQRALEHFQRVREAYERLMPE
jgi:hypothetical protein